ncbi:hypothetical protein ANN_20149 [Periplaneta americana]|uniref:Reverse transcriptase domain-containing protein n=1 Tax=Periplaneta americana TaxID=6978 RepID=A0ABQ8SCW7_PERAM|nr:hypothetical protein ANN_20149 [Periplaneta americana]
MPTTTAGGDDRANHTIPPFWLDDRPPLLRHVGDSDGKSSGLGVSPVSTPESGFRSALSAENLTCSEPEEARASPHYPTRNKTREDFLSSAVVRMVWYTLSFTVPHRKKSSGDRSGQRAGHCTWIVASTVVVVCIRVKAANTQQTTCTDVSRLSSCKGTRQGDGLVPLLFNIALHIAIIKSEVQINGTIFNKTQQILGYADDVIITGRRIQDVEEALIALDMETQKLGFKINTKKSKFMSVTKRQNDQVKEVKMGTYKFEKVKEFTYLGSILTANNDLRNEVQRRINLANRAYYSLLPIVKNKIISREIKIKIYKTLMRPIITYGTETWVLNKNTCKQLAVFERKILRRIFGAIETVDGWRARYNNEIYELYKESDLEAHKMSKTEMVGTRHKDGNNKESEHCLQ